MACRIGMSTKPEERIAYWKREENATYGWVVRSGLTYNQALKMEKGLAKTLGCRVSGGGPRKPGRVWSVYRVEGGTQLPGR